MKFIKHNCIDINEQKVYLGIGDNNIVFDIGARTDCLLADLNNTNKIYAFEPNPEFYIDLVENNKNKNVVCVNMGIADFQGESIYYNNSQSIRHNKSYNYDYQSKFTIKLTTLPIYCNSNNITHIDLLKTDCEGLDYDILKHSIDFINKLKIPYIQFEFWHEGVKPFQELLTEYNLYFINGAPYVEYIENKECLLYVDSDLLNILDNILTPKDMGGNIFCVRKTLDTNIVDFINNIQEQD